LELNTAFRKGGFMVVTTKFISSYLFDNKSAGSNLKIVSDANKDSTDKKGFNPLELLLSALGSCIGVYANKYLDSRKISFKEINITTSAEVGGTPERLINLMVRLKTDVDLKENNDNFLRYVKNCLVHNTLLHTEDIKIDLS